MYHLRPSCNFCINFFNLRFVIPTANISESHNTNRNYFKQPGINRQTQRSIRGPPIPHIPTNIYKVVF